MSQLPAKQVRERRAATIAAIIVAAVLIVIGLFVSDLPSRAAAAVGETTSFGDNSSPAETQLAAASAAERAQLAQAAKAKAAAVAVAATKARAAAAAARTLNVWTTGFQTQINECKGAVDVTAHYGTRAVAEHWQCGGSSFPTAKGTIVTITGQDAGTYRVVGIVAILNAYTAHASDIPKGYSLIFQTCRHGDSHTTEFVGLEKV